LGKIQNLVSFPITQKYKNFFQKSYIFAIYSNIFEKAIRKACNYGNLEIVKSLFEKRSDVKLLNLIYLQMLAIMVI
jgi:hypothetical protein